MDLQGFVNYIAQIGNMLSPLHNPDGYSPTMEISQEQMLGTKRLWKNKLLLCQYISVHRVIKK